jgi:site-specific DNA-methyltransferase (adenine-specific)
MNPYYSHPTAELYLGHALDVLAELPTESVDLVITDPPYGVEWQSNRRAERFGQLFADTTNDRDGIRAVMAEAVRIVGQNRHLYAFGPADVLEGLKVAEVVELVWNKNRPGMGDLTAPWAPAHERISFTTSKHRHAGEAGKPNLPARLRKGSVLTFSPPTGRKVRHPSEKPVALLRELIESSSRAGDLVLDPFAGSGSTGVAAVLSGRRAILVETDEHYAELAADRLAAAAGIAAEAALL